MQLCCLVPQVWGGRRCSNSDRDVPGSTAQFSRNRDLCLRANSCTCVSCLIPQSKPRLPVMSFWTPGQPAKSYDWAPKQAAGLQPPAVMRTRLLGPRLPIHWAWTAPGELLYGLSGYAGPAGPQIVHTVWPIYRSRQWDRLRSPAATSRGLSILSNYVKRHICCGAAIGASGAFLNNPPLTVQLGCAALADLVATRSDRLVARKLLMALRQQHYKPDSCSRGWPLPVSAGGTGARFATASASVTR